MNVITLTAVLEVVPLIQNSMFNIQKKANELNKKYIW